MAMLTLEQVRARMLPFSRLLGIEVTQLEPDLVVARMVVRDDLCTDPPILHGGAAMALADTLGGIAAYINLPPDIAGTTTVESKTNFVGMAPAGTLVIGRATPVHRGRQTQVWQTRITTADGRLVAQTTQTQLVLHPRE